MRHTWCWADKGWVASQPIGFVIYHEVVCTKFTKGIAVFSAHTSRHR
jgi:hypothetical protein